MEVGAEQVVPVSMSVCAQASPCVAGLPSEAPRVCPAVCPWTTVPQCVSAPGLPGRGGRQQLTPAPSRSLPLLPPVTRLETLAASFLHVRALHLWEPSLGPLEGQQCGRRGLGNLTQNCLALPHL